MADSNKKPSELESMTDALKEITKAVTEMSKEVTNLKEEWAKWRKAGKF